MPDKLTDNEIVKAFELCLKCEDFTGCRECPAIDTEHNTIPKCRLALFNSVLNLINHLEAKNKNLQERNVILRGLCDTQKAEVERLNTYLDVIGYSTDKIKVEAYKEFAERLKEKSGKVEMVCSGALVQRDYTISEKTLDNLLKELVGEDK